jgi:hypothetical protein
MVPAVAHAFEFPGKKRLDRDNYIAVQTIYYPGFTMLGFAEPGATIAVTFLLVRTPVGTAAFWQTFLALLGLLGMQIIYWTLIQVNRYWLSARTLGNLGGRFFSVSSPSRSTPTRAAKRTVGGSCAIDGTLALARAGLSRLLIAHPFALGQK